MQPSPLGSVSQDLAVPAQCPATPYWGGNDGKTLHITTARQSRSAQELTDFPHSGCVLSTRVEVPGLTTNFFRD